MRGICSIFTMLVLPLAIAAQPTPTFEVASIRPNHSGANRSGTNTEKGSLRSENVTLRQMIRSAYDLPEDQISGGPDWIASDRFDINAKADHSAGDAELMLMLRALLAERFHLTVHMEKRMLSGYALLVDKGGVKAKPSTPDAHSSTNTRSNSVNGARTASLTATGSDMHRMAEVLTNSLHAPVEDQTGLSGKYDFQLDWTDDLQARANAGQSGEAPSGASIFSAVRDQLGLRLESRKVSAEVLLVDHAELPTEN